MKNRNMDLTLEEFNALPLRERIDRCPICRGDGTLMYNTDKRWPQDKIEEECSECRGSGFFYKDRR